MMGREKQRMTTPADKGSSRARPARERKRGARGGVTFACVLLAAGAMAAACRPTGAGDTGRNADGRRTPSGFPVPRYVSLKFDEVNARGGPGDDYKLLWTYRARGLPLQVIAETNDWRRVCDPEGGMAWVHQRTVDTRRTVMRVQAEPLDLHRRAQSDSPVDARLAGRAIAALDRCEAGWCRVSVDKTAGWTPETEVWGAAEGLRCRALTRVVKR
jgi:SH3-like domain-containing protein